MATTKVDVCTDCRQGYTRSGYSAHPDHIELCPRHSSVVDLRLALAEAIRLRTLQCGATDKVVKSWTEVLFPTKEVK